MKATGKKATTHREYTQKFGTYAVTDMRDGTVHMRCWTYTRAKLCADALNSPGMKFWRVIKGGRS